MKHHHAITDNPGQLLGVVALSAAIGAVVAMLFTPKNDHDLRRGLRRRAKKLADEAEDMVERGGAEASATAEDTKQRLQDVASEVARAAKKPNKKSE